MTNERWWNYSNFRSYLSESSESAFFAPEFESGIYTLKWYFRLFTTQIKINNFFQLNSPILQAAQCLLKNAHPVHNILLQAYAYNTVVMVRSVSAKPKRETEGRRKWCCSTRICCSKSRSTHGVPENRFVISAECTQKSVICLTDKLHAIFVISTQKEFVRWM